MALDDVNRLPNGARFFRCALQVNPFDYVRRHKGQSEFSDEESYNNALIAELLQNDVEVISITDHYRVSGIGTLRKAAEEAGIHVLPGFEAVTKDGVHLLCIFDQNKSEQELERLIGECGIRDEAAESPVGKLDCLDLLEHARRWGSACVAAHVAGDGGLLHTLSGQTRINAWQSPDLLACALPGSADDAPDNLRPIIKNKNPEHRRSLSIAVINAQDVSDPSDVSKSGSSCWIKMSDVTVEGLRQAFLDPSSRIRLASDPQPVEHAELLRMNWQGGFLDGASLNLNANLNVLVGGRGTGKSTVIESIRYVLGIDPIGKDAISAHEDIIKRVLRAGTKVSLVLSSHMPARREYLIERTVPNPPLVKDENGDVLPLTPIDVIPRIEIFGQHEISELTKAASARTQLLERFIDESSEAEVAKSEIRRKLAASRVRIIQIRSDIEAAEERLADLPALEETLKRYKDAGLEGQLKERSEIVEEEQVKARVPVEIAELDDMLGELKEKLPVNVEFLSDEELGELPGKPILGRYRGVLSELSGSLEQIVTTWSAAIEKAKSDTKEIDRDWEERKAEVQGRYEKLLRDLKATSVDAEEFIKLREKIEQLRPLQTQVKQNRAQLENEVTKRNTYLAEWEDAKAEQLRKLERAAKRVTRKLKGRVRVKVSPAGDRSALESLLRDRVGGQMANVIERLNSHENLSLTELANACRSGPDSLREKFGLTPTQSKNISESSPELPFEIEELELTSTTNLELNISADEDEASWRTLEELSTGQKATAVLLLLLLDSDAPLIVDQPEDDLDNRFITGGVVPRMKEEKRKRQFIFATHNANVPVLGDAELILGLVATGEAEEGKARIPREYMGSSDAPAVCEMVEEILEGGKEAFEMRRLKYGF